MTLTEHELAVLEDKPVYATVHDVMALIAELRASQAEVRRLRAALESLEWKPQRNAAGGITDFCLWCGGCVGAYRTNERVQPGRHRFRPDGHKADCRIALALDQARTALAEPAPAPAREGT